MAMIHMCPPDLDYADLDPGIRLTVRWLRGLGYFTCDSGDGATKPADAREFEIPHVVVMCEPSDLVAEVDKIAALIAGFGFGIQTGDPETSPDVQGTYGCGVATIIVMNVGDGNLPEGLGE